MIFCSVDIFLQVLIKLSLVQVDLAVLPQSVGIVVVFSENAGGITAVWDDGGSVGIDAGDLYFLGMRLDILV